MFNKLLLVLVAFAFSLTGCYTQIAEDTPDDLVAQNSHTTPVLYGVGDKVDLSDDDSGFEGYYVGSDTSVYSDSTGDVVVIDNYYERLKYIESLGYEIPESKYALVGYFPPTTVYVDRYYPPNWNFGWNFGWGSSWCGYWGGWSYPSYCYYDFYYPSYCYPNYGYHPGYAYVGGKYVPSPYKYRNDYNGNLRDRNGRGYATRGTSSRTRNVADNSSGSRNNSGYSRNASGRSSGTDLSKLPRAARDYSGSSRTAATSRSGKNRVASSRGVKIDGETLEKIRSNPRYRNKGNIKSNSRESRLINARYKKLAEMGKSSSGNIRDNKSKRGISSSSSNSDRSTRGRSITSTPSTLTPKKSPTTSSRSSSNSSWGSSSSRSSSSSSYSKPSSSSSSRSYSKPSSSSSSRSYSSPSRSSSSRSSASRSSSSSSRSGSSSRRR